MAQSYNSYPRRQGGLGGKITDTWGSNEPPQLSEQQMLAQQLKFPNRKFRGRSIMPQQQLTEEERMMVMQLMQQGMNEQQAIQQVMSMKSG